MRTIGKQAVFFAVLAIVACGTGHSAALAADVLANGGLENSTGPAGWTLTAEIVGLPGVFANATEHVDFANEPMGAEGELGLFTRPFAGNVGAFAGQNRALNLTLSQTVAAGANRTFTFTGHSLPQGSSSTIVTNMEALTPLGDYNLDTVVNAADYTIWRDTLGSTEDFRANGTNEGASLDVIDQADYDFWKARFGDAGHLAGTPSPTQSFFRVEFLNASDVVLATHSVDLRDDPTVDAWRTQSLVGIVSPVGTTKARVSAGFTNGVASCSICMAGQDLWLDNFSLNQTSTPFAGEKLTNGNLNTLGAPSGWVIEKTAQDNLSFAGNPDFAAHTGNVGMWLRSFTGGDAKILQTVAATAGADYDFSAWVKWESGFSGFDPLSATQGFMTIEFLDALNAVLGTETLNLRDVVPFPVDPPAGEWNQFSVNGTAPANTVNVRLSAGATDMQDSGIDPQSAFFDDFALIETLPGAGGLAAGAVPEPSSFALLGIALGMIGVGRRNG